MAKVVTFGEIMLRLAPNGYYRFFQNDQFLSVGQKQMLRFLLQITDLTAFMLQSFRIMQ